MLPGQRDEMAATTFFKQALNGNGFPHKIVMNKSGANHAGIENINLLLMLAGLISFIEICQVKYLILIEQDHRFINKITKPIMGFKAFHSAKATLDGIETAHKIRKGQLSEGTCPFNKQFMALAG
jgi:putative transposase